MEITAIIKRIEATKEVGTNKFKIRDLVVTTEEQYPQTIAIQFSQEKTEALNIFNPGEKVKVSFNLRGREVTNKDGELVVYNTIQGWKIEKTS